MYDALAVWLACGSAHAGTATNLTTAIGYGTVQLAVDAANPGDEIELDGPFDEAVTVQESVTLLASPKGAEISSSSAAVLTLFAGVDVTVDGVSLNAKGATRLIDAGFGGDTLTVRHATLSGATTYVGLEGGMVRVVEPVGLTFEDVTFEATPGVSLAKSGGGLWVTGAVSVELTDVRFVGVTADGNGGAVFASGPTVACVRCTFEHTEGGFGGAVHAVGGSLEVRESTFCATKGSLGGAVFGEDVEVFSTVFLENEATQGSALYANGGDWIVRNNHFLGSTSAVSGASVYRSGTTDFLEARNNLFLEHPDVALDAGSGPRLVTFNYFFGNGTNADPTPLDGSNVEAVVDPGLVAWSADGDCANDDLTPLAVVSPLLDAGDPAISDPDGSPSDIGAFGGEFADGLLHKDGDGDGASTLWDCDDLDFAVQDVVFYADCDEDGQGAPDGGTVGCERPLGSPPGCTKGDWASAIALGPLAWSDCDDAEAAVFSGADETCDLLDRDCDGDPYDGAIDAHDWFLDLDLDGFGGLAFEDCASGVPGWVSVGGDCDDASKASYPGAPDPCGDGVDSDCGGFDGTADQLVPWYADLDGDGFGDPGSAARFDCPGLPTAGASSDAGDCDDSAADVHPGAAEVCNGADDDCDQAVDDVDGARTCHPDLDGDGAGDAAVSVSAPCPPADTWVELGGDCDDADPERIACAVDGCRCATGAPRGGALAALPLLLGLLRRRA